MWLVCKHSVVSVSGDSREHVSSEAAGRSAQAARAGPNPPADHRVVIIPLHGRLSVRRPSPVSPPERRQPTFWTWFTLDESCVVFRCGTLGCASGVSVDKMNCWWGKFHIGSTTESSRTNVPSILFRRTWLFCACACVELTRKGTCCGPCVGIRWITQG